MQLGLNGSYFWAQPRPGLNKITSSLYDIIYRDLGRRVIETTGLNVDISHNIYVRQFNLKLMLMYRGNADKTGKVI